MGIQRKKHLEIFMKCRLALDGLWREVPSQFCDLLGYTDEELQRKTFGEVIHPEDRKENSAFLEKLNNGDFSELESQFRFVDKSGNIIRVFASFAHIRDKEGNSEYISCIIQNLSEQEEIREKLEIREQQFDSLFKNNPHPVYYFDHEGNFDGVNDKLVEFTGYSREELLQMGFKDFIVEEDLERTQKHFQKALAGDSGQYEIKVRIKTGEIREIRVTKFPRYSGNEVAGVYGILQDITKENQSKKNLERSEQHFKSLFERNPDAVYSFDKEGNFIQANTSLEKLTGYSIDELKTLNFEPLVTSEDREMVLEKFEKTMQGKPQTYEASGVHKDGHKIYVQITNLPIYVDGEIIGVFGIAHNITERNKAQQRLEESEERWQQLVEQNPQPVQIVQNGKIVFINQSGADYYGAASPEELNGKNILDFVHPDSKEDVLNRKRELEQNKTVQPHENKIILLNGEEKFIEAHSIPITYNGKSAIQTVVHDITDLKEKQRVISRSLKEKETLLKEIHHRVKNNLAMISSMLELQIMQSPAEAATIALRDSQLRIRSIAMIHEKLYQNESLHDISFDDYLEELVQSIKHTYEGTDKSINLSFNLDSVALDINQVIPCSLIVNEVVVNSFKHAFTDQKHGNLHLSLNCKNPVVELTIEDDGKGLPDNFKMDDHQSLGMTLIQALSDQLEGTVQFKKSPEGKGTLFQLQFEKRSD